VAVLVYPASTIQGRAAFSSSPWGWAGGAADRQGKAKPAPPARLVRATADVGSVGGEGSIGSGCLGLPVVGILGVADR